MYVQIVRRITTVENGLLVGFPSCRGRRHPDVAVSRRVVDTACGAVVRGGEGRDVLEGSENSEGPERVRISHETLVDEGVRELIRRHAPHLRVHL